MQAVRRQFFRRDPAISQVFFGQGHFIRIGHSREDDAVQELAVFLLIAPDTGRSLQGDRKARFLPYFPAKAGFKVFRETQAAAGKFPMMQPFGIVLLQQQQLPFVENHRFDTQPHQYIRFLRHNPSLLSQQIHCNK